MQCVTCLSDCDGRGFVKHLSRSYNELHVYQGSYGRGFMKHPAESCNALHVYQEVMDAVL